MAANGLSNIHNDTWMSDAYTWAGPLGRSPRTFSTLINRDCGSITFDRRGRLVSVCINLQGPQLYMLDPRTLATLATFSLPGRDLTGLLTDRNLFQDFTGGGYFFLDNHDNVWAATTTRHVLEIGENSGAPGFHQIADYDVSTALRSGEKINSALPDFTGRIWFVAKKDGVIAQFDPSTSRSHPRVKLIRLSQLYDRSEEIENSFTVDRDAIYVVSNRAMYRLTIAADGTPRVVWREVFANFGHQKPGQVDDGSGSTPTVTTGGYVAITDNADPMDVVVYRKAATLPPGTARQVCAEPVFRIPAPHPLLPDPFGATAANYASDDENSLIAAGDSLIAENNYGYETPLSVTAGQDTASGIARVDVLPGGTGCRTVWTNGYEHVPTVVSKLSLATGLVYTYTKDPDPDASDPWFWTAVDFRTGQTVWKQLAGTGSYLYNNNYAGLAISPAGTEYLGVLGGVVALRDAR
jgi:hypothetical protein